MTDRQRLELLERAVDELKLTTRGYTPAGVHWRSAMVDLAKLGKDLAPAPAPIVKLVSPIPRGVKLAVGGLHRTAGDATFAENWALDFVCPAGTPVLCPEAATVKRLSGHDPADDQADRDGVFGWSIHFETAAGFHYFLTHLGKRAGHAVGDKAKVGTILGWVGDQRFRPDHAHLGVTAPSGKASPAEAKIKTVRAAPRIAA